LRTAANTFSIDYSESGHRSLRGSTRTTSTHCYYCTARCRVPRITKRPFGELNGGGISPDEAMMNALAMLGKKDDT